MSQTTQRPFAESEGRADAMHSAIEEWLDDLVELTDEARANEQFQDWLEVQSRFHDYSFQNALLIKQQCPNATAVAGYKAWQEQFDRQVKEDEKAIWIWAPIVVKRCPSCQNGQSYHETAECEDQTPKEEWKRGVVGFRPVPVFDVSQTEGESLPELATEAYGDGSDLAERLLAVAPELGIEASVVPESEWTHGSIKGVCRRGTDGPEVEVLAQDNDAQVASVLVHEFAHAQLHVGDGEIDRLERAKREVEAEAVAYVVGRRFGLDVDNAAFYIAHWEGEGRDVIAERLARISETASELIEVMEASNC